ncbi:putative peptide modification system cyclase [Xanthomonas campestris pv. raphani]|uniref:putative peptide modification system cyclase n=1 Tax=Xanthomonas campestris TaxID=339 RepID=UPI000E3291F9|nr:putative peptide modification system cyclase [Xanthomonas campestris]MCC8485740.1 putative peptide modification system cyclase [Xanthomonas campestris]MEA9651815.1 putative peptide modification system cyclase [Xanthomonas campestris pv. raphani]MEA9744363.1 putative peptide modification system cyclase [Xanthomonas campestris pv. raphani]MEA9768746.1 putative peptide modification system cyclase [Xanthomonas campestris pv. raphani]MEA9844741.1 putative peptide modification system cyclase [Xan
MTTRSHARKEASSEAIQAPRLRTLLLTDLCDSTALVERIGDNAAAALFREHDHLVVKLQQHWRGRLIDRSDGLLLLFDRPIDGLGFALDYARGLKLLGETRDLVVRARQGLHVGEVLTWRNSDEAVSIGAKPLEVEGLAKPTAARLMSMARPGQILLSAVAESLTHRAARELGTPSERLLWKSHGRWRFKGMPTPMEIYEVGEVGLTPLRAPKSSAKAWRDIPLWRRPAALATEVALVLLTAGILWVFGRPEPAIAFGERDWVVVGDLHNLTDSAMLDEPLQQALRLSLQQSKHVNLVSEKRAHDMLQLMRQSDRATIDRARGAQIALRSGAKALILPSVADVGGNLRVTVEVVDPVTQATVYMYNAEGRGQRSLLSSIDTVSSNLRAGLGETLASIKVNSAPLPRVSTANMDALNAYALAQREFGTGHYLRARDYYLRAVELDPTFALANVGVARCNYYLENPSLGLPYLEKAFSFRAKLPPREQVYLDAWYAQIKDPSNAYEKWMQMSNLYPDDFAAAENTAYALEVRNRYSEALVYAKNAAASRYDFDPLSLEIVGRMQLALGKNTEALATFRSARTSGLASAAVWEAVTLAVLGDFPAAHAIWPDEKRLDVAYFDHVSIYIDEGRSDKALPEIQRLSQGIAQTSTRYSQSLVAKAATQYAQGKHADALATIEATVPMALSSIATSADAFSQRSNAVVAGSLALLGQRLGQGDTAKAVLQTIMDKPELAKMPAVAELLVLLQARMALLEGRAAETVQLLKPRLDGHELYQYHVVLKEAYTSLGDQRAAANESRWLKNAHGRAYAEFGGCGWCQQPMNVFDAMTASGK